MASISYDRKTGRRTVQFVAGDGTRKTVRLGKCSQRIADEVCRRVEALNAAAVAACSPDKETAQWVAELPDKLYKRLARAGLAQAREHHRAAKLGTFLDMYIAGRKDVKAGTRTNFEITKARMVDFFGADRELRSITEGDVEDWKVHLHGKYARATVGKSLKHARQFFRSALRRRIVTANPFEAVKAPGQKNEARSFHVTREVVQQVLDACPDNEWRLMFALSRYGGLRCPSEHLGLRWADVDWARDRFHVHAPKTEHNEDGGDRWVPIFPELRPYLEAAWEAAPEGAVYVIAGRRDTNANLRTQLARIIRKVGLTPWPRLFQNLRASRETELTKSYPLHVACKWIGNSPRVAADHYLQVTEEHFESAAESGAVALQKGVQHVAAGFRTESQEATEGPKGLDVMRSGAAMCETVQDRQVTPTGFEPVSRP